MASALTLTACLDAGHVRLAELGAALQAARRADNEGDTLRLVESILHLRLFLEDAARLPAGSPEQARTLSYLTETYGLASALTDPLLRATLPAVPTTGAKVRYRVRSINGKLLVHNGKAVRAGAVLVS